MSIPLNILFEETRYYDVYPQIPGAIPKKNLKPSTSPLTKSDVIKLLALFVQCEKAIYNNAKKNSPIQLRMDFDPTDLTKISDRLEVIDRPSSRWARQSPEIEIAYRVEIGTGEDFWAAAKSQGGNIYDESTKLLNTKIAPLIFDPLKKKNLVLIDAYDENENGHYIQAGLLNKSKELVLLLRWLYDHKFRGGIIQGTIYASNAVDLGKQMNLYSYQSIKD